MERAVQAGGVPVHGPEMSGQGWGPGSLRTGQTRGTLPTLVEWMGDWEVGAGILHPGERVPSSRDRPQVPATTWAACACMLVCGGGQGSVSLSAVPTSGDVCSLPWLLGHRARVVSGGRRPDTRPRQGEAPELSAAKVGPAAKVNRKRATSRSVHLTLSTPEATCSAISHPRRTQLS